MPKMIAATGPVRKPAQMRLKFGLATPPFVAIL
jgi:hypothetical protein